MIFLKLQDDTDPGSPQRQRDTGSQSPQTSPDTLSTPAAKAPSPTLTSGLDAESARKTSGHTVGGGSAYSDTSQEVPLASSHGQSSRQKQVLYIYQSQLHSKSKLFYATLKQNAR